jgi:parallel beta-helix repeat protein
MSRLAGVMGAFIVGALAAGCSSSSTTDGGPDAGGVDGGYFVAGQTTESEIAAAFSNAAPGATLTFGPGTFTFTNTLALSAKNLTITGAGMASTILEFAGQTGGADGIDALDGTDGITFSDFTLQNAAQNGIKVLGATGVTFLRVNVTWTGSVLQNHGPYGIYPISDKNVLIDSCSVSGASDSGIYVGQSDMIIVRNSTASKNVAGIEIENSFNADVHDNTASDNTAGVLVFDLPNLPQQGGHNVRVYNNSIVHNNTANFAAEGDIVGIVPAGTGFFVMANHGVEVFGNTIQQNHTVGLAVISYLITGDPIGDAGYYPYPSQVYLHDNIAPCDGSADSNGTAPDETQELGLLLATAAPLFPDNVLPTQMFDGFVDPAVAADAGSGNPDPMQICFSNNNVGNLQTDGGATGFANLHFDQFDIDAGPVGNLAEILTQDLNHYTCTLPALPAVSF